MVVMTHTFLVKRSMNKSGRSSGVGVLALCLTCFLGAHPLASAQSAGKASSYNPHPRSSHPPSFSAKYYKSAGPAHNLQGHSHSSVTPVTRPKSSGVASTAVASHERELNQLEHTTNLEARHSPALHSASPAPKATTRRANDHSAPINFTHKDAQVAHQAPRSSAH